VRERGKGAAPETTKDLMLAKPKDPNRVDSCGKRKKTLLKTGKLRKEKKNALKKSEESCLG